MQRQLKRLAWLTLLVNVGVILLGALVRATGSGAGCGNSWPTCQGEVIPSQLEGATAIEYLHRLTSGLALLLVLVLYAVVRRSASAGTPVRTAALLSLITIIGEALIGAGIVLFEWVADDSSIARTVAVPTHLVNTLLLLAALTTVAYLVDGRPIGRPAPAVRRLLKWGLAAMLLVAASGAVAALADTLFPSGSLSAGVADDFDTSAGFLTRLRIIHPVIAVLTGILLVWIAARPRLRDHPASRVVTWLVVAQILAGLLNIVLLVPVWMQLVHLFLADALWVSFVWFGLSVSTDATVQSNSTNAA